MPLRLKPLRFLKKIGNLATNLPGPAGWIGKGISGGIDLIQGSGGKPTFQTLPSQPITPPMPFVGSVTPYKPELTGFAKFKDFVMQPISLIVLGSVSGLSLVYYLFTKNRRPRAKRRR